MVADLVTQLQPLSAPMKADHPSGNGLGENCSNHPHHGGCQNLDCTSIMNVNWNHRKGKGNRQLGLLRVRSQQIYFCSPVCAYTLGYEMEDLKLGFHMTLPKTYRELIYYLQTDFCCKLHKHKFYESICILNLFALKGQSYGKDLVPNWNQIKQQLLKLNLPSQIKHLLVDPSQLVKPDLVDRKRRLEETSKPVTKKAKTE